MVDANKELKIYLIITNRKTEKRKILEVTEYSYRDFEKTIKCYEDTCDIIVKRRAGDNFEISET